MIFAPPLSSIAPPLPSALELDLPADELMDFLENLAAPALVVRCGGISLFRKGPLGKVCSRILTKPLLTPSEFAPLSIDPSAIRRICLLRGQGGGPSLEIEFASFGFALSVRCVDDRTDRGMLRELLEKITSRTLSVDSLNRAGAAAWLDDFPTSTSPEWRSRILFDQETNGVSLSLHSPGLAATTSFVPTFIDRDGETLRLANAGGDRVIHVHTGSSASPIPDSLRPHHARP
jgi:hypothetical protein